MAENIHIEPDAVTGAGKNVADGTDSARARMSGLFGRCRIGSTINEMGGTVHSVR